MSFLCSENDYNFVLKDGGAYLHQTQYVSVLDQEIRVYLKYPLSISHHFSSTTRFRLVC
jgi:hypothetical protein